MSRTRPSRPVGPPTWWRRLPDPSRPSGRLPVELKVLVSDASLPALRHIGRPLPSRSVHYFDTPGLDLAARGIVVRLRTTDDRLADATVKVRRDDPVRLPRSVRRDRGLMVEIDSLPDAAAWSAALRRKLPSRELDRVLDGRVSPVDLFTPAQRSLYRLDVEDGSGPLRLERIGPVRVRRRLLAVLPSGARVVAETCRYPDGSRLTEVSAKCSPERADRTAEELTTLLVELGIDSAARQTTKTRTALEILSADQD